MVFPQCRKHKANPQKTYKPEKHVNQTFMTVKVHKEIDGCQRKAYRISRFSLEVQTPSWLWESRASSPTNMGGTNPLMSTPS